MKPINLCFLLFSLTLSLASKAQEIPAEADIEEIIFIQQVMSTDYISNPDPSFSPGIITGNTAWIWQTGNHNKATISQEGNYNVSGIVQSGDYNEADLDLSGNRNTAIIEQYGSFNTADKTLTGDDNSFYLLQNGDGLIFNIEATLPPGTTITQEGNGMRLEIK